MQIINNIALISINETMIVQVVSFLIFLFIINRVMIRPLRSVMTDREFYIENVQNDIQSAQAEIEVISGQISRQESAVKDEALHLRAELEDAGQQRAKEIIRAARKEIAAADAAVRADINRRLSETRAALKNESEVLAVQMIEKILDRRLQQ